LAFCRDVSALAEYSPEVEAVVLQKWNGKHTWYLSQESLPLVLASRCPYCSLYHHHHHHHHDIMTYISDDLHV
jgi:hypothetical protein